jgi:hypothetical protein
MRFDFNYISEDTRPYFRDIYDHAMRINEMIDNSRELLNTALGSKLFIDLHFPKRSVQKICRLGRNYRTYSTNNGGGYLWYELQ